MKLDSKIPSGPLAEKWDNHKFEMKLVNPKNKRKFKIIVGKGNPGSFGPGAIRGKAGFPVPGENWG